MKSLREHLSESLADRNGVPKHFNKNLHAKMVAHAKDHISSIADDIEDGVNSAARVMGKHNAGSVYHGVEDHLADHLHDKFHRHPGYNDAATVGPGVQGRSIARHVAKKVTAMYIHDDRPEYRAAVRNHEAKQKRAEAAKNRPARVPKPKPEKASGPLKHVWVSGKTGNKYVPMRLPPWKPAEK